VGEAEEGKMNQQRLYFAHALVIERGKPGTVLRFNREFFATSKDDVAGQMKRYVDSELPGCVLGLGISSNFDEGGRRHTPQLEEGDREMTDAHAPVSRLPESYRNVEDGARRLARIANNRPAINRQRRKNYLANISKVRERQLELFRENPQLLLKLKYVVCLELECGAKLDILKGNKGGCLWQIHGMTVEQYTEKWPGAPLVSIAFRQRNGNDHGH
jgi:hypothetical protein